MARSKNEIDGKSLLAKGGGNATAAGVTFHGSVSAYIAVQVLTETRCDRRLALGSAKPVALKFETEAPVDDTLVETDQSGWIFYQAKNRLANLSSVSSELGKTCDEFARLWQLTTKGTGGKGWDRPMVFGRDAMVIAVGPTSSNTIKVHLARALDALRSGTVVEMPSEQRKALTSFRSLMRKVLTAHDGAQASVNPDDILKYVYVLDFDFGGPHRDAATAMLGAELEDPSQASGAFTILERTCEEQMGARGGIRSAGLRAVVARGGIAVKAPMDFARDVQALRDRTIGVAVDLTDYLTTRVDGVEVTIDRACTNAAVDAAMSGSLVVVGDPGAGKSAVIYQAAERLKAQGSEVVMLTVDRLQVETVEGLSSALGIVHPIERVLANWPGVGPAYLFLDALDACRFGKSEALFRAVIQGVLGMNGGRWRVIASIRTFDLLVGQEFARLFRGVPRNANFVDARFQGVSHIRVPDWSEDEFAELLTKIPALKTAIDRGGPKLRELAHVPFNTRLLADLLYDGMAPEVFASLSSQVQLLDIYWNRRVRPLGAAAEQCLRNTVLAMIGKGRMESSRLDAGKETGNAVDELLRAGVLISTSNDRSVAFRHHILFDYIASRVLIDFSDVSRLDELLKPSGAAMLLAPALNFALVDLWENSGEGRREFWNIVVHLAGDTLSNPVARSISARVGSDLPSVPSDLTGLLLLIDRSEPDAAIAALRQVTSSLTVRIEDETNAPAAPWCALAANLAPIVGKVPWPVRQILGNFIDRTSDKQLRAELGTSARALLAYAFDAPNGQFLMPLAINFVGKTFDTDIPASRLLFERLISEERMEQHAVNEMPWVAEQVENVASVDPRLAAEIYRRGFEFKIADDGETQMGDSQILPLRSNRRQDYKHAQWRLKEAFPKIIANSPLEAADIALIVARAHITSEHAPSDDRRKTTFNVDGAEKTLSDDYSHIWASHDRSLSSEYEQEIVAALVDHIQDCPDVDAQAIIDRLLQQEIPAWIWARLFMIGARRGGSIASKLWPIATQLAFLTSSDTLKDAIDLIEKGYGDRTPDERQAFERSILNLTASNSSEPGRSRAYIQQRVFGFLREEKLTLEEAKAISRAAVAQGNGIENERLYRLCTTEWVERDGDFHWLRENSVDVDAPNNVKVLGQLSLLKAKKAMEGVKPKQLVTILIALAEALRVGDADTQVASYGWEKLASDIETLTQRGESVQALSLDTRARLIGLLDQVIVAANQPASNEIETNTRERTRESAAEAAMNLARVDKNTAKALESVIARFSTDHSHRVRRAISSRLGYLWDVDRDRLWELTKIFSERETDARVLLGMVNFLIRAIHLASEQVEERTQCLLRRTDIADGESRDVLSEGFGTLTFLLWVRYGRENSRRTLTTWLGHRADFRTELLSGAHSLQAALVLGYEADSSDLDIETRRRSQSLAFEIVDVTASGLEEFLALPNDHRVGAKSGAAKTDAEVLDKMSDQFLFAVGASEIRQEGEPKALKGLAKRRQFLDDNKATFRRVGDVGTPHTIYYLLQLLEFLMPANPSLVFDLVAHALLKAGKIHGYQGESLGADQFVRMIGRFVADHRELFSEDQRRGTLVSVLEVFVDAGWPSARRLLYRLPEALR